MTTAERFVALGAAGIVAVALLALWSGDGQSDTSRVLGDSLAATATAHVETVTVWKERAERKVNQASGRATEATIAAARAEGLQRAADSMAVLAAERNSAADSALAWKQAYEKRTEEADSLRVSVTKWEQAFTLERDARLLETARAAAWEARSKAHERLNASLARDIARRKKTVWVDRVMSFGLGRASVRIG